MRAEDARSSTREASPCAARRRGRPSGRSPTLVRGGVCVRRRAAHARCRVPTASSTRNQHDETLVQRCVRGDDGAPGEPDTSEPAGGRRLGGRFVLLYLRAGRFDACTPRSQSWIERDRPPVRPGDRWGGRRQRDIRVQRSALPTRARNGRFAVAFAPVASRAALPRGRTA